MKKTLILGNWKAHKRRNEIEAWMRVYREKMNGEESSDKTIVLFPPLLYLPEIAVMHQNTTLLLGAQTVSSFEEGSFTGEVTASQVCDYATYVLIGHSERRHFFHENEELLLEKVHLAKKAGLTVIYCISEKGIVPDGVDIVAYEPLTAIGSGMPDSPENASEIAKEIKRQNLHVQRVVYGGSVTSENVHSFTKNEDIDGVLVGSASLIPEEFLKIIAYA